MGTIMPYELRIENNGRSGNCGK